jgi:hypothetical protein
VVTRTTRVVVRGQTCTVVDPTPKAWAEEVGVPAGVGAAAAAVGRKEEEEEEEEEEEDVVFGGLLSQLCLRLKLATTTSRTRGSRSSRGTNSGRHAVVVEGSAGSGKTSLVGAAARRLGLPTVLIRPGDLLAHFDVEADAALAAAAATAQALAPAVLLVDNADLLCGAAGGGGRAGRLLAASRGEVDRAVERWLAGGLEEGPATGVALVLTVGDGWRLRGGGGGGVTEGDSAPRIRMAAAAVGPATARAVLRWELRGLSIEIATATAALEEAARGCQGFTLGETAAVARRARTLCSSSSSFSSSPPSLQAAFDAALAEARTRRLAAGTGLPALGKVDPPVTWGDVGGLRSAKQAVQEMVTWPMAHSGAFARLGIAPPTGLLLYGPPGTGKTLIAKAVACQVRGERKERNVLDIYVAEGPWIIHPSYDGSPVANGTISMMNNAPTHPHNHRPARPSWRCASPTSCAGRSARRKSRCGTPFAPPCGAGRP